MNTERNPRKRILVTGAAGFIGAHLARRLTRLGYEVTGIDNLNHYCTARFSSTPVSTRCVIHRISAFTKWTSQTTRG